ncbi:MAG: hypothetical protein HZA28_04715, partial [Candidatus Omnitrophica bacterium]|nr:hypothetical protein [Candidatus Omnitrophota bacterium]
MSDNSLMTVDTAGANPVTYSLYSGGVSGMYATRNNTAPAATVNILMPEFAPITIYAPNGGETWQVGQTDATITWVYADRMLSGGGGTGGVHQVKLELSPNGGTNWYAIPGAATLDVNNATGGVNNQGKFVWNPLPASITGISNLIGTTLKVKVTDIESGYTSFLDSSNANFYIKGQLTVDQPPNTWRLGETQNIIWATKGNLNSLTPNDMTIKLATDGTNFTNTLIATANPGADGSTGNAWLWNPIPSSLNGENLIGTTNKIKLILNYNASGVVESTTANFTLKGRIYNVSPTTSETWLLGDSKTITWSKNGKFGGGASEGTVDIFYSSNGGLSYDLVPIVSNYASGTDAGGGSYPWTIPVNTTLSNPNSRIKVQQSNDNTVYGESADFLMKASVTVDEPVGGEIWRYGDSRSVKWTPHGALGSVVIKYKVGAGSWNYLPGAAPSDNLAAGTAEQQQTHPWVISNPLGAGQAVTVRVGKNGAEDAIFDDCDTAIYLKGIITVSEPHASELVKVTNATEGNTKWINWSINGSMTGTAHISLSQDTGASWPLILSTGVVNITTGAYEWTVLDTHTGVDKVKVSLDGDTDATTGTSGISGTFKTVNYLKLVYPNAAGLSFYVGNVMYIKWTPDPATFGTVDIRYDTAGGTGGYTGFIADGVASDNIPGGETQIGYKWTIPDVPGIVDNDIRIKVYQTGKVDEVFAASQYDISIKGTLKLTTPSDTLTTPTLVWGCGTQENIQWDVTGSLGYVYLYYSKDNGVDNYSNTIDISGNVSAGTGTGSYLWTIPADATVFKTGDNGMNTQVRIKVAAVIDQTGIYSTSLQPLTIQSRFTNLVPNGGSITVGAPFNITWSTQGDVATVNVKYSTDGGSTWGGSITTGASNAGGWDWNPVNSPLDNDIRVRVESASHPDDINLSSAQNINSKGKLEITTPSVANVGASALVPGEVFRINWITNGGLGSNVGLVDLYFAADGTTFGSSIASVDTASANFYDWTVPSGVSIPGTTNKLKIVAQAPADGSVNDLSDAFDIRGKLWNGTSNHAMVEPNGGEVYYVGGANIDVQWKYKGNIGDCDIYYSINSGGAYPNFVATIPHNQNEASGVSHHSMTVPGAAGVGLRVKISSTNDSTNVYAASQANFAVKGQIVLNSPGKNAGSPEVWYVDGNNQISFTITGGISTVDILFDKNSGKGADNSYGTADDYGTLTIVAAQTSVNGANNYAWNIPSNQEADRLLVTTNKARVRVRDANDTTVYSDSTNDFSMKPKVTIGTISGSPWTVEEQKTISWTTTGTISQLNLYYSAAGQSGPWGAAQITGIDAAGGSTIWTIPTTAVSWGSAVLKLVRYESGVEDTDVISQTSNFTVKGKISVTAPLTNQTYNVQQTGQITWNVVGAVGNVDIKYNTNSGGGYPDTDWVAFTGATGIVPDYCTNVPGTPYTFTIPSSTAANVKVRVVESSHAEVFGPQMAGSPTHKFKGSIVFDKPTAGAPNTKNQTITIGQTPHRIDWSIVGTFTTLKAYYKKIGDAQWTQIGSDLGGTVTNTDYSPADANITLLNGSDKVLFRVEDALDASDVFAETPSGEGNTIIGALSMMEPITPAEFTVGSTVQVKWKKYGNIGNLKFELWNGTAWLDNAGGSNLPDTYSSGTSGESGVIMVPDWAVPDKIGTGRKIRVTSLTYPALTGETGLFSIKGGFNSIVTPGTWYVGEDHTISWQANGTMSSVKIELYDGSGWQTISAAYDNGGSGLSNGANNYLWSGADTAQQQRCDNSCKIKVTSNQNTNVFIETLTFTLKPKITVTTPASSWIAESASNIITWDAIAAPTTNVDVILNDNNSGVGYPVTLASNIVKGASPYTSTVPLPATLTNAAVIRVRDTSFPALVYGDTATFKVIGQIIMHPVDNTPNSTSNWEAGATDKFITWSHKGNLGTVNIRYKYNGGAYSAPINGSAIPVADHSFAWTPIPNTISENAQVKIESVSNPAEEYAESAAFKIIGKFTLSEPGTLNSGAPYSIAWTNPVGQSAQITDVILEFYNGTSWSYLVASPYTVPNTESYGWTVPTDVR